MKKHLWIFAAAAAALAACSNDDTIAVNQGIEDANTISFRPVVTNLTRAADIDNGSGTNGLQTLGFKVFADVTGGANYFPETSFTYSSSTYTSGSTKYYWPSSGTLDFFAYQYSEAENNTVTHTALTKAFTVTPSETAGSQTDLVVACTTGKSKTGTYNTTSEYGKDGVPLNFRHAESKVTIKLKNSSTTTTITTGNVVIGNVYTVGTYTFTGSTDNAETPTTTTNTDGNNSAYLKYSDWSAQGTSGAYTQATTTTSYTSATDATALANSMILIPQALTYADVYSGTTARDGETAGSPFNGSYITVQLKIQNKANNAYIVGDADNFVTALWPLPAGTWKPGYHYTYTVDLAGGGYYPDNHDTNVDLDPILEGAEIKFVNVTVDSWSDPINNDVGMLP